MKGLGFLGTMLHNPNIWHLNRHSVSKAFVIGLFWMSIPIPLQMLASALTAILFRANLPISVALVWISNPLTMPPIFYFNYLVGSFILGDEAQESLHFELSWHWIFNVLGELWLPLYLGSIVVGLVLGFISYLAVKLLWRHHVYKNWLARKRSKASNK